MKTESNELEQNEEAKNDAIIKGEKKLRDDFFEQMYKINYFEQLSRVKGKLHEFNVTIKVAGFDELNLLAADILKICIHTLQIESAYSSEIVRHPKINILSLLELVIQLMPENLELYDELHQTYLKMENLKK